MKPFAESVPFRRGQASRGGFNSLSALTGQTKRRLPMRSTFTAAVMMAVILFFVGCGDDVVPAPSPDAGPSATCAQKEGCPDAGPSPTSPDR